MNFYEGTILLKNFDFLNEDIFIKSKEVSG